MRARPVEKTRVPAARTFAGHRRWHGSAAFAHGFFRPRVAFGRIRPVPRPVDVATVSCAPFSVCPLARCGRIAAKRVCASRRGLRSLPAAAGGIRQSQPLPINRRARTSRAIAGPRNSSRLEELQQGALQFPVAQVPSDRQRFFAEWVDARVVHGLATSIGAE